MKEINRLKAQIRAINLKLKDCPPKTEKAYYKAKNKVKTLKEKLSIITDNYNWENYLSK